jgi:hypothetical protein
MASLAEGKLTYAYSLCHPERSEGTYALFASGWKRCRVNHSPYFFPASFFNFSICAR